MVWGSSFSSASPQRLASSCLVETTFPQALNLVSSDGLSRRSDVLGYNCDEFKPERWIRRQDESKEVFAKRRLAIERSDTTFADGSGVCVGKNVAMLELHKAIATLIGPLEASFCEHRHGTGAVKFTNTAFPTSSTSSVHRRCSKSTLGSGRGACNLSDEPVQVVSLIQ